LCPICYLKLDLPPYFGTLDASLEERQTGITHGKTVGYLVPSFDFEMAPPARFEHAAYGLGNRRSIRLSYGGIAGTGIAGPRAGQSSVG
jgi:hypothetical protein